METSRFDQFILSKYKIIFAVLILIFIISLLGFVHVILEKENNIQGKINITPSPTISQLIQPTEGLASPAPTDISIIPDFGKSEQEINIAKMQVGSTEIIDIVANKKTEGDYIALIRLRIEGGEITDVTSKYVNLGTCQNDSKIFMAQICVDVAKTEPFIEGEVIASITIKWQDTPGQHIFRSAEDGMYNGIDFNASN